MALSFSLQQDHKQHRCQQHSTYALRHTIRRDQGAINTKTMASPSRPAQLGSSSSVFSRFLYLPVLLNTLLLLVACSLSTVEASSKIINATALVTASTDNEKYEHQVVLLNNSGADEELDEVLIFRWQNPSDGVLNAALEHTTSNSENKPSWLALGFFDGFRNTVPIFDDTMEQVNGQAVIGTYFFANPAVFKYSLGTSHGSEDVPNGGVALMPDSHQTLIFQNMEQGTLADPEGSESIRTVLMFAKNLDEGDDKEEATLKEAGDNILVWALGPPGMETLGMHDQQGAFRLDFQTAAAVSAAADPADAEIVTEPQPESQQESPSSVTEESTAAPDVADTADDAAPKFIIINGTDTFEAIAGRDTPAGNPYSTFDHQVQLDENLMLYWKDPTSNGILNGRLEHKAASAATAPSWLSFGFYNVVKNERPVTNANFNMSGSTAIIGTSWVQENPLIYSLGANHDQPGVVQPLGEQATHLMESSFLQFSDTNEGGIVFTTLSFQKSMVHPTSDEAPIVAIGDNIFLWAMGPPGATSLGMHSEYGALRLDLMVASEGGSDSGTSAPVLTPAPGAVEETISVIDATTEVRVSTDADFDYQVQLEQDVIFRWEAPDPGTGLFTGRLEHQTNDLDATPAWLGFGLPNPTDMSTWMLMQNTYAIIGMLPSEKVEKYSLGVKNNHTQGFVQALPLEQQTLQVTKMLQDHNKETGVYTTSLTFSKLLVEESNPLEAPIWTNGENRFLWAVGNALTESPTLSMHRDFGAMTVDFSKVAEKASSIATVAPEPSAETSAPAPATETSAPETSTPAENPPTSSNAYSAPVIVGRCESTVFEKSGKSIRLTPSLVMHWQINDSEGIDFTEFGVVPSLTVILEYSGLAWLGFGVSPTPQAHNLGATGIIGVPATKDSPQLKYNISSLQVDQIVPMADQTLIEAYVNQEENQPGKTTLRFTKALVDGAEEVQIKRKGLNFFSFAVGNGNVLGYHKHRGSFQLDLEECYDLPPGTDPSSSQFTDGSETSEKAKGALKAHAIMAAIAWGFTMPCAVGIAWFRQLIPTAWIYIHVSFNLLTFLLTLMAVLVGVAAVSSRDNSSHLTKAHHVVGILLFVAYTFQVGNGFLRPPVERKEDGSPVERKLFSLTTPQSPREWWHMIHRSMGITMLLVGIYQIASGMELFDENFESGRDNFFWYWGYIGIFCLVMISLKIWLIMQNRRARGHGASWVEDRASTSVGIDTMMQSDPDGMNMDDDEDCVVLEIPSRSGESTMIRGARRMPPNMATEDDDNMTVEIT